MHHLKLFLYVLSVSIWTSLWWAMFVFNIWPQLNDPLIKALPGHFTLIFVLWFIFALIVGFSSVVYLVVYWDEE